MLSQRNKCSETEMSSFIPQTKNESAMALLDEPAFSGMVEKKSKSIWVVLLPCIYSPYQSRLLVLVGSYLYRFVDEVSQKPKGSPIALENAAFRVCKDDVQSFEVVTLVKKYIFRVDSRATASAWVSNLIKRKANAISEELGHLKITPAVARANRVGAKLCAKAQRIRDMHETEMSINPMFA